MSANSMVAPSLRAEESANKKERHGYRLMTGD